MAREFYPRYFSGTQYHCQRIVMMVTPCNRILEISGVELMNRTWNCFQTKKIESSQEFNYAKYTIQYLDIFLGLLPTVHISFPDLPLAAASPSPAATLSFRSLDRNI